MSLCGPLRILNQLRIHKGLAHSHWEWELFVYLATFLNKNVILKYKRFSCLYQQDVIGILKGLTLPWNNIFQKTITVCLLNAQPGLPLVDDVHGFHKPQNWEKRLLTLSTCAPQIHLRRSE
jgi:hypothetical protein